MKRNLNKHFEIQFRVVKRYGRMSIQMREYPKYDWDGKVFDNWFKVKVIKFIAKYQQIIYFE